MINKFTLGISFLLIMVLFSSNLKAQQYERYFEDTINFQEGDTLEVKEFMYDSLIINSAQPFKDILVENLLVLKINEKTNQKVNHSFNFTVELDVIYFDSAGNASSPVPVDLSISYRPDSSLEYNNRAIFRTQGAHRILAIITNITPDSLSDTIPVNVVLEGHIYIDRVYDFNCSDTFALEDISHELIIATDEIEVSWPAKDGAIKYELEWVSVSNKNITYNQDMGVDTTHPEFYVYVDFPNDASKVSVNTNSYRISNVFADTTTLFFRVRAIGRSQEDPNKLIKGRWMIDEHTFEGFSSSGSDYPGFPFFPLYNVPFSYFFSVMPHEDSLNWQYGAVYAEEGKKKEIVTYADGANYSKQTVTKTNTNNVALVQETKYDSIGRPAVSFLPVPSFDSVIRHYDLFNVNYAGQSYTWRDFEKGCGTSPDVAGTTKGASRYYSTSNPQKNLWQNYLPDAEGIPFTQTRFLPDARSLPAAKSAPGDDHKIGSGHETRYFYGTAEQESLDKLFGTEAGNALRYSKEMVVDANGQINVTYKNLEGKPLATALAGDSVAGMRKLDSNTGATVDTFDFSDYNIPDTIRHCISSSRTVLVTNLGSPLTVFYSVSPQELELGCDTFEFCYDCLYDLEISITNDCGNHGLPGSIPFSYSKRNFNLWEFDTTCGNTIAAIDTVFQVAVSEVGSYMINKSLCINTEALEFYRERYLNNDTNCRKPYSEFLDSALANVTIDCGEFNCAECLSELGSKETYVSNALANLDSMKTPDVHTEEDSLRVALEWDKAYEGCNQPCQTFNYCNAAEETMLNDLRPGGQYARIYETEGGYYRSNDTLSILNETNLLDIVSTPSAKSWRNPVTPYLDIYGQVMQILWDDTLRYPQQLPDSIFIAYYQNNKHWAKSLLSYHPEYRYLEFCRLTEASATYQQQMMMTNRYEAAVDSGYFNPLNDSWVTYFPANTDNIDPYFSSDSFGINLLDIVKWKMRKNANYMNDTAKSADIWTIAVRSVLTSCNPFNSVSVDSFLEHADTATLNKLWLVYRGLYLSLRQQVIEKQRTYYATSYEGYCGCIDNKNRIVPSLVLQQFNVVHKALTPVFPYNFPYPFDLKFFPKYFFLPYSNGFPALPPTQVSLHTADSNFISFWAHNNHWFSAMGYLEDDQFPVSTFVEHLLFTDLIPPFIVSDNANQHLSRYQPCNAATASLYESRKRRFPDMDQALGLNINNESDQTAMDDALKIANDSLPDNYNKGCELTAEQWLESIGGCIRQLSGNVDSATIREQVKQELINVCKLGTDMNHPFGASTAPPGKQTAMGNKSFEDVIKQPAYGFVMSDSCNINFITFPVAYHHSVEPNQAFVTDVCLCDRVQQAFASYNTNLLECDSNRLALDSLKSYLDVAVANGLPDSTGTIYIPIAGLNILNLDTSAQDPNAQVGYNPLKCDDVELCDTFVVNIDTFYRPQEVISYVLDTVWDGTEIDTILVNELVLSDTQVVIVPDTLWFKKFCGNCNECSYSGTVSYNQTKQIKLFRGWRESNWTSSWNEFIGFFEDTIFISSCGRSIPLKVPITFGDHNSEFDSPVIIDDSIFGNGYYGHIRFQHPASGSASIGDEADLFINNFEDYTDSAIITIDGNFIISVYFNDCVDYTKICDTCLTHYIAPISYRDTIYNICETGDEFHQIIPVYIPDCNRHMNLTLFDFEVSEDVYDSEPVEDMVLYGDGTDYDALFGWGIALSHNAFTGNLTMKADTDQCYFILALEGVVEGVMQSTFSDACEDKPCNYCEEQFTGTMEHSLLIDTTHAVIHPDGTKLIWIQDTIHFPKCGKTAVYDYYIPMPQVGDTTSFENILISEYLDEVGYLVQMNLYGSAEIYHAGAGLVVNKSGTLSGTGIFSDCDNDASLYSPELTLAECHYQAGDTVISVQQQFIDADFGCSAITVSDLLPCDTSETVDLDVIYNINACGRSVEVMSSRVTQYPNCGTQAWYVYVPNDHLYYNGYHNINYLAANDSIIFNRVDGGCVDTVKITRKYFRDSVDISFFFIDTLTSAYPPATAAIYVNTVTGGGYTSDCTISLRPVNAPAGFDWSLVTAISNVQPDPTFTTVGGNQNFIAKAVLSGGDTITIKGTACTALEYCEALNNAMSFHEYFNILYGTKLGCDGLSDVLCSCNDSIGSPLKKRLDIPDSLTCRRCVTCPKIQEAIDTFHVRYPYVADTGDYYSTTLTNFLNREFGYVLTYADYANFLSYCESDPEADQELCNQAPFTTDPDTACHDYRLAMAENHARSAYSAYLDSLTKDFEQQYANKCLSVIDTFKVSKPSNEYHYTLYYYDLKGNLIKTIPPLGVQQLAKAKVDSVKLLRKNNYPKELVPAHTLASIYEFNTLDQNVREYSPDGGNKRMYYDALGRPVVVRDSVMLASSDSAAQYTLYDALGRVKETGIAYNAAYMQYATAKDTAQFSAWYNAAGKRNISRTYYDEPLAWVPDWFTNGEQENLCNRVATTTWQDKWSAYGINPGDSIRSYFAYHHTYDVAGNVKEMLNENRLMPDSHRIKNINYDYDLISGKVNKVDYNPTGADRLIHRYEYDADNRLIRTYTSKDGLVEETDAENFYYDHGPLARVELGENKVQGIDYVYNIHGWVKGINSGSINSPWRDAGKDGHIQGGNVQQYTARDAAAYTLGYYAGDYAAIGTSAFEAAYNTSGMGGATNLYNGNIRNMSTAIRKFGEVRGAAYQYDQLNRLMQIDNYLDNMSGNTWVSVAKVNDWHERFKYDANGNIQELIRRGTTKNSNQLAMDSAKFTLFDKTNRLKTATDLVAINNYKTDLDGTGTLYLYDANGSVKQDFSTGHKYQWHEHNQKLKKVVQKRDSLLFAYDALGNRNLKSRIGKDSTFYVNDLQGNIMASYKLKNDSLYLVEQPLYGSSRLGSEESYKLLWQRDTNVVYGNALYGTVRGNKQYEVNNHLGNVLATVSDKKVGVDSTGDNVFDYYNPVEITATDYYAYGGVLPERQYPKESNCVTTKTACVDTFFVNTFTDAYKVDSAVYDGHIKWLTYAGYDNLSVVNSGGSNQLRVNAYIQGTRHAFIYDSLPTAKACTLKFNNTRSAGVSSVIIGAYYWNGSGWTLIGSTLTTSSTNVTFTFTTNSNVSFHRIGIWTNNYAAGRYFLVDNAHLYYSDSCVVTTCNDTANSYAWGFNGKMKDNEVQGESGFIDFGMREQDTRIAGRFLTLDPKKQLYPWNSPYTNAENRPIEGVDLNGEGFGDYLDVLANKVYEIGTSVKKTYNDVSQKVNQLTDKAMNKVDNFIYNSISSFKKTSIGRAMSKSTEKYDKINISVSLKIKDEEIKSSASTKLINIELENQYPDVGPVGIRDEFELFGVKGGNYGIETELPYKASVGLEGSANYNGTGDISPNVKIGVPLVNVFVKSQTDEKGNSSNSYGYQVGVDRSIGPVEINLSYESGRTSDKIED